MLRGFVFAVVAIAVLGVSGSNAVEAMDHWKGPTPTNPDPVFYNRHKLDAGKDSLQKWIIETKWKWRFRKYKGFNYTPFKEAAADPVESTGDAE